MRFWTSRRVRPDRDIWITDDSSVVIEHDLFASAKSVQHEKSGLTFRVIYARVCWHSASLRDSNHLFLLHLVRTCIVLHVMQLFVLYSLFSCIQWFFTEKFFSLYSFFLAMTLCKEITVLHYTELLNLLVVSIQRTSIGKHAISEEELSVLKHKPWCACVLFYTKLP